MAYAVTNSNLLDRPILVDLDSTGVSSQVHEVGTVVRGDDGKAYRFVEFNSSDVAASTGAPAIWQNTTTDYAVTSDTSDGDAEGGAFAGIFCSVLTDTYYGWIQIEGEADNVHVDSGVSKGDALYVDQSNVLAGIGDAFSSATENVFIQCGVAKTDAAAGDGASTSTVILRRVV